MLLDDLSAALCVQYLSELREAHCAREMEKWIEKTPAHQYAENQWRDTVEYLYGGSANGLTGEQARMHLLVQLRAGAAE